MSTRTSDVRSAKLLAGTATGTLIALAMAFSATPAQAQLFGGKKKPKEDFFGADKSCKYAYFTMGGGKIDIQMVCSEEGTTQTTNMSGSYTPTSYSMDMSSSGSGGRPARVVSSAAP